MCGAVAWDGRGLDGLGPGEGRSGKSRRERWARVETRCLGTGGHGGCEEAATSCSSCRKGRCLTTLACFSQALMTGACSSFGPLSSPMARCFDSPLAGDVEGACTAVLPSLLAELQREDRNLLKKVIVGPPKTGQKLKSCPLHPPKVAGLDILGPAVRWTDSLAALARTRLASLAGRGQ